MKDDPGQPHLAYVGIGLGLLQDDLGAGEQRCEHMVDVLLPQNFTHTQRAGKGQVHCHIEFAVRILVQGGADHIGGPDIPLFMFHFRQDHIIEWILGNQLPPNYLLEGTAEKFDDLLNSGVGDKLRFGVVRPGIHRRGFL